MLAQNQHETVHTGLFPGRFWVCGDDSWWAPSPEDSVNNRELISCLQQYFNILFYFKAVFSLLDSPGLFLWLISISPFLSCCLYTFSSCPLHIPLLAIGCYLFGMTQNGWKYWCFPPTEIQTIKIALDIMIPRCLGKFQNAGKHFPVCERKQHSFLTSFGFHQPH